ncbi:flavin reductase family protein [Campylobacter sp. faydin G-140]|uniref:flavin reductase family protein n=1 Tax=Campylobacter anatolicus TaxID=2829105 RepID=UPI001B98AD28|nr:flavin reductase family protein [Campylobacter anatolicus]MBR8466001.1 flavin reductase family protein [Campylobacter anatolicus]
MAIKPVELNKFYRLLNIGSTNIISAKFKEQENAMSATWAYPLDYAPMPKAMVVLGDDSFTRKLILKSGFFAIQVPVAPQAHMVMKLGTTSGNDDKNKIANCGAEVFYIDGFDLPLIKGCIGWVICKLLPNEMNQNEHGLFIGEVVGAFSDDRVFENGHFKFDEVGDEWRTLHYVAGSQFYLIGKGLKTNISLDA